MSLCGAKMVTNSWDEAILLVKCHTQMITSDVPHRHAFWLHMRKECQEGLAGRHWEPKPCLFFGNLPWASGENGKEVLLNVSLFVKNDLCPSNELIPAELLIEPPVEFPLPCVIYSVIVPHNDPSVP
ncbi:hypothetical protein Tco_0086771 [Tanacetum coccineum]